jgi:PAS domain S-box-containing protein
MKSEHKVIGLSLILGLSIWIIDAVLDYYLFYEGTFWGLLISDVPKHEVYIRLVVVASFLIFGLLISRVLTMRKRVEEELQNTEKRYRNLFEETSDALYMTALDGKIMDLNQSAVDLFGYTREEMLGLNAREVYVNPVDRHGYQQAIMQKGPIRDYEVKFRRKDGTEIDCLLTANVRRSEDGTILGYQGIIRDITERKRAEEQINASLKEKEVLLKEIHHRVKNNLQIISSLLSLQSGYTNNTDALELIKDSQNRVRSMALIHETLYRSKDLASINLADYVRMLTSNLFQSYRINSNTISLNINIHDVLFDINRAIPCGLIINELVSNSLKHAFPAGKEGEIHIDLHSDNNKLRLIISDTGVGFPKDLDFRNTGTLGLELVTTLTDQLKGTIELHSNGGTELKIIFPA